MKITTIVEVISAENGHDSETLARTARAEKGKGEHSNPQAAHSLLETQTLAQIQADFGGLVFTVEIPKDENPEETISVEFDLQHLADLPPDTPVHLAVERHYSYEEAKRLGLRDPDRVD